MTFDLTSLQLLRRNTTDPESPPMSKRPHPITIAWLPAAILLALTGTASAQDTSAQSPAKAKQLSAVIVTGTRADNRTESSSLTPIDVVSAKVLQQTGTSELSTALARIIPSLTFPRPSAADTADSQRPAQLRGLSPDQVLVLVDGKRWHPGAIIITNGVLGRGSQAHVSSRGATMRMPMRSPVHHTIQVWNRGT